MTTTIGEAISRDVAAAYAAARAVPPVVLPSVQVLDMLGVRGRTICAELGIPRPVFSMWLHGRRAPSAAQLTRLDALARMAFLHARMAFRAGENPVFDRRFDRVRELLNDVPHQAAA